MVDTHIRLKRSTNVIEAAEARENRKKSELASSLYGRPLHEVDPFVFKETFCVIAKKYGHHYVYRFSATKSLFLFGPVHPVRRIACKIMSNQIFDLFIILVIAANCITLALDTNWEIGSTGVMHEDPYQSFIIGITEFIFLAIYTIEMVTKIAAKGFLFNKFAYLRNAWNCLDFVVVCSGYVTIVLNQTGVGGDNLEFLRILRVLRAFKTISLLPGLRMMIDTLLSSVVQLLEVMILTLLVLMIFSLLALQLYMGKLRQKCVLIKNGPAHIEKVEEGARIEEELYPINPWDVDAGEKWYEWVNREDNWLERVDGYPKDEFVPCGNGSWSRRCLLGYVCLGNIGNNFDEGWTNFDNFFSSMLSTFQLITLDFWERLYDLILSTTSPGHVLFFLLVIFLGSFYLLNLMLAVVAMSYEEEYQSAKTPMPYQQKLSLHRSSSAFSLDDPVRLNVRILNQYHKLTLSEREMQAKTLKRGSSGSTVTSDGKKKGNLHSAIMTLLGRRISMEGEPPKGAKSTRFFEGEDEESAHENDGTHATSAGSTPHMEKSFESIKTFKEITHVVSKVILKGAKAVSRGAVRSANACCRFLHRVHVLLLPVVNHWSFEVLITSCIIINTTLLASEHHKQPKWLDDTLDYGNHFFTAVFVFEAVIKICALQKEYFKSYWNIFDLFVVIVSLVDALIESYNLKLSVIRSMRLLRVFKLAQSWITMKVLLNIIFSTFGALGNLTLVLIIVLYIFAVLGLQVVGHYYTKDAFEAASKEEEFPRWNFHNFFYAFMMVFRLICGEWVEPLWDCLKATHESKNEVKCFMIYLPVVIIGNFIILNLFLALLLNSFDTEELETQRAKELEASGKADDQLKRYANILSRTKSSDGVEASMSLDSVDGPHRQAQLAQREAARGRARFQKIAKKIIFLNRKKIVEKMIEKARMKRKNQHSAVAKVNTLLVNKSSFNLGSSESLADQEKDPRSSLPGACFPDKCWKQNCMCFICARSTKTGCWGRFRKLACAIVYHPIFEWMILGLIFASSITLCFEDVYLETKPSVQEALFYINSVFTGIFVLEMLLKWFALGVWIYFTSSWTLLDFFIVAVSLITWYPDLQNRISGEQDALASSNTGINLSSLKALRTLRALRPLRAISRWEGMKIVVNALMFAIPSIVNVLLVCLLFWLIFSIMGVQFFKGKFYKCVDNDSGDILPVKKVKSKMECCNRTNEWSWINTQPNFDNVLLGYLTLFQVATFEGWMEAMQAAVDSTEIDQQPERDKSFSYYLFFVIFIVFGSFFTLNLFIGVIIDNFNRLKKQYEGSLVEALLTPSQRRYYTTMLKLNRKKPQKVIKRPASTFLSLFYDISLSRRFEISIFIMIFLNIIIMGFETHDQREVMSHTFFCFNAFFTAIYGLEALVKIIGLRQYYFTVLWNLFDFILVIASIVELSCADKCGLDNGFPVPPTMLRIVRIFRLGRVLRLIKAAKGIRKLLFALVVSLPALFNIGALLALITFIYAVLGMALFGKVAKNTTIDEVFNFETFMRSCIMLLRIMTAAGWNDVLIALTPITPECGSYRNIKCGRTGEGDCASVGLAILYLVSYLLISYLIVINMYIAIILENFEQASKEEEVGIIEDDLDLFYVRWSRYDPDATQFISFDQLSDFLASLDPPLGVPKPNIVAIVAFNLPIARGNRIHCLDILHALIRRVIGHVDDTENFRKLQEQMEHKFRKQFPTRKLLDIISSTRVWKIQHNAAVVIQRAWRAYRQRKYGITAVKSSYSTNQHHQNAAGAKEKGGDVVGKMGHLLHLGDHNKGGKNH